MTDGAPPVDSSGSDAPPYTAFRVGVGLALVSSSTLCLLEPVNGELADELWRLVAAGSDIDDLLEALSATGLRSLGAFAMAQFENNGVRVVVRGTARADVGEAGSFTSISAVGVRTWVEEVVPNTTIVTLHLGQATDTLLPFRVRSGIVPADLLSRGSADPLPLQNADFSWVDSFDAERVVPRHVLADAGTMRAPPIELGSPASNDAPRPAGIDPDRTIAARDLDRDVAASVEVEGSAHPPTPTVAPDDYDFDKIFGRTVARSVLDAAVHFSDPSIVPPTDGMIEGVPSAADPSIAPSIAPGPAGQAPLGDHDGRTISKAQLRAMRGQPDHHAGVAQPALGGPNVQAVRCVNQHPNPPHLATCSTCGTPLVGDPVLISRPIMGVLRFKGGQTVNLDRPVLIGRNPKLEGRMPSEMPQLLKLDVGHGLSRTHAIVRLEGWQVLIEDLNSANGTVVTQPGVAPRRLHAGEPAILEYGASIEFGGEVFADFGPV